MGRAEKSAGIRWQLWTNIGISCVLLVLIIMAGRKVRHYVTKDPQFTLATPDERTPGLSMQGLVYTSRSRVLDTFEADFGRSIFLVPLPERRRRLLAVGHREQRAAHAGRRVRGGGGAAGAARPRGSLAADLVQHLPIARELELLDPVGGGPRALRCLEALDGRVVHHRGAAPVENPAQRRDGPLRVGE